MEQGVREIDLRNCCGSSVADRVGIVPGLRSSAAFFTFLRANLILSQSAVSSNYNTPLLEPYCPQPSQIRPSPSPCATTCNGTNESPLVPLDDIPPLSLDALTDEVDKIEGLRLVAESVSEMRLRASKAVLWHPLTLAALSTSYAVIYRFSYLPSKNINGSLMLALGISILCMLTIRFFTSGYSSIAASIDSDWLRPDHSRNEDIILGARIDKSLVAALVLRLEHKVMAPVAPKRKNRSRSRSSSFRNGGKGIIRAWTTQVKHRGQGVGMDLLHEAVRLTRERCGKDAQVGFALEHANANMLLPTMFNAAFRMDEVRATKALEGAVADWNVSSKRRKK